MKEKIRNFLDKNPKLRKTAGIFLTIIGIISVLTPFTPLGIFLIVGLEMLGVRETLWIRLKGWFK